MVKYPAEDPAGQRGVEGHGHMQDVVEDLSISTTTENVICSDSKLPSVYDF
jgi:hypothetical protein